MSRVLLLTHVCCVCTPSCWDVGGFYGKLTTNCFVLPALGFGCCALMYYNQRRTIGAVIAAGGADESAFRMATVGFQQNVFFVIFLIYPLVTVCRP
jgi:hypothetical protein